MKLTNSHPGLKGRSLIEKIEIQMDKLRVKMEGAILALGIEGIQNNPVYITNKGRYEGLAAALKILRNSSVREEISRSNERLGIE